MENMDFVLSVILDSRQVVAVLNTRTDEVTILKSESSETALNTPVCYTAHIRRYLETSWVHPDDLPFFELMMDLDRLREFCLRQKNGAVLTFRRMREGRVCWARIVGNIPGDFSDEHPEMLLSLSYLSEEEEDIHEASRTVGDTIRKALKYEYALDRTRILKQPDGDNERLRPGDWMAEEYSVLPDDLEEFRRITDREALRIWFQEGNQQKNTYYRRKLGGRYRWVRLNIQPASNYVSEAPVWLAYVVDVNRPTAAFNTGHRETLLQQTTGGNDTAAYVDNMLHALSFLTQQYKDFYIVDLKADRYMKYKMDRAMINGSASNVGCYSEMAERSAAGAKQLMGYATLEELRMILEEKVSFDYAFTRLDGKTYRTTCTRIEMENGVPTKMLAYTQLDDRGSRLRVRTFGSFEVYDSTGKPIAFRKKKSRQLLAYLVDQYGFPAATADLVQDVLEKDPSDLNAKKYVSTLYRMAADDLAAAGYPGIIIKEWNSLRVDVDRLDCDYYHLMEGDLSYLTQYHGEYMKEYSWAEMTNAEIMNYGR